MQEVNLPAEFLKRMQGMLKEEYPAFLAGYKKERACGLRVNTGKISCEDAKRLMPFSFAPVEWCDTGFSYQEQERPGKHPYHEAGLYYIQEPSAMAAAELLTPALGERILDLCAAPGGKTTQIAAKLQRTGLLVSNEIHPQRVKILSQNVERMGLRNTVVTNETPERLAERFPEYFDRIIVDAPCSGEGMFRKDQQAVTEWSPENVPRCAKRQKEILSCAYHMLRFGGFLVYSTCTFSEEENEEVIETLLKEHKELTPTERTMPDSFVKCRIPGAYRLYPHRLKGEGHFVSVLQKGQAGARRTLPELKPFRDKKALQEYNNFKKEAGISIEGENYLLFGDHLYLVPEGMIDLKGLKVERPGLQLGAFKKNRFEPSHALAMALHAEEAQNHISFPADSPQIQAYFRGESIPVPDGGTLRGWRLVLVDGCPAGWGKASGGIIKNHYPKGLRVELSNI